ncbi:MAG: TonB-dependent receptor [Myxococcota bacterium]
MHALLVGIVLAPITLLADGEAVDTSDLAGLLDEPIVSTASLTAESARLAPGTSWTITADDLRRFGVATLADALNFLSLGMITERRVDFAEAGSRGVLLTGDYGSHMLMLLDGHALNEQWDSAIYFDRTAAIPFDIIDHLEIVLGPGSVLYGSNAMLGVINIITKRGSDLRGVRASLEAQGISGLRAGVSVGHAFTVLGIGGDALLGLEYYGAQGPALTMGPQDYGADGVTGEPRRFTANPNGDGIWGGTLDQGRFVQAPSGYLRASWGDWALDLRAASAKRGEAFALYTNFNDPHGYERDRWLSGDVRYQHAVASVGEIDLRLYGDAYDYFEHNPTRAAEQCLDGQVEGCTFRLVGRSQWGGLEARTTLDWLSDGRLVTLVGVDGRLRHSSSTEHYVDFVSRIAEETSAYARSERAIGAYLEQRAQPFAWLGLNVGARYDDDQRFGHHVSPRAALTLSPWSDGVIKAVVSEAFRAPNAFERYYFDPTSWLVADELRPEIVRSAELSVEQRVGAHRLLVGGFYSRWTDLVALATLTPDELDAAIANGQLEAAVDEAYQYRNIASMTSYGGNAAISGALLERRLRYVATVTVAHTRANDGETTQRLPVAAELFGNARLSYELGGRLPTVAVVGRYVAARRVDFSDFEPWPTAPAQTELRLTLTGAVPGIEAWSYRVSGNYAFADVTPYAVGPLASAQGDYTAQEMAPVDRMTFLVGLQYDRAF